MSDFDSVQFPLQLHHINLLLFDAVDDLLLRPRYLFLITQLATRRHKSHCDWPSIFSWQEGGVGPPLYLFAESFSLDRDGFVCAMNLQDTNGTDTALTRPTVHLDKRTHKRFPSDKQHHKVT